MGAVALRVTDAEKHYGSALRTSPVFSDVSLAVQSGETLVLLGPSGCGKSTLLRVLAGLETLSRGSVEVLDRDPAGRPSVGLVFQDPLLLPWLSVRDNVSLGLQYGANRAAASDADVGALLAEFGLEELADLLPPQLSGGQAQRVSLARTIITGPRVLLLDEPFAALDPRTRESLQQWLRAVKERHGLTVVLVTHDLDEALLLADRVLLFSSRPGTVVGQWDARHATSPENRAALRAGILRLYQTDIRDAARGAHAYAATP